MVSTLELDIEFRGNLNNLMQQIELDKKSKLEREKLLKEENKNLLKKKLLTKMLSEKVEMERYLQEQRQKK